MEFLLELLGEGRIVDDQQILQFTQNFRFDFSSRPQYTLDHPVSQGSTFGFQRACARRARNSRSVPRENRKG